MLIGSQWRVCDGYCTKGDIVEKEDRNGVRLDPPGT